MIKTYKQILIGTSALLALSIGYYTHAQNSIGFSLEIKRGPITIGTSGSLNLGDITISSEERIISVGEIFQIKDKSGLNGGHYTTIQISDLSKGTDSISKENIFLKYNNVTKIAGVENNSILLGNNILNQRGSPSSPSIYLKRTAGTNYGYIGQYGSTGEIKINVPTNQATGTYRGKIYYLLVDNN